VWTRAEKDHLSKKSQLKFNHIEKEINLMISNLTALTSFYDASNYVSYDEFNVFTKNLIKTNSSIKALEWVPKITSDLQRSYLKREMEKYGYLNFNITRKNKKGNLVKQNAQKVYFPVVYIAPFEENKKAHGYDLYSNNLRKKALMKSEKLKTKIATEKIHLVQDEGKDNSILIVEPIYKKKMQKELLGYTLLVVNITKMLADVLDEFKDGDNLIVKDKTALGEKIFYLQEDKSMKYTFYNVKSVRVANRIWELKSTHELSLLNSPNRNIFYIGLVLTLSFALLISLMLNNHQKGRNLIFLNHELEKKNTMLEQKQNMLRFNHDALEEKNIELKKVKNATLSILEDIQIEKMKTEQLNKKLLISNEELENFAYITSHDLKAPLRGLSDLIGYIREDINTHSIDQKIVNNINRMEIQINRLDSLIIGILNYSKVGSLNTQIKKNELNDVINKVLSDLKIPDEVKINISCDCGTTLVDETKLSQVISNLIDNAIKYHDNIKNAEITINVNQENNVLTLSVGDNGPGINSKYHTKIFEMFHKLQSRDDIEGTGIGLAIVKKIIINNGGDIVLESSQGNGANFICTWPLTKKLNDIS
jgi:signal transduction histidine kinase